MGLTYPHQGNPSVSVNGAGTNLGLQAATYGTAAEWTAANPVLGKGEIGYETDTYVHKVGDGSTAWASLTAAGSGTYASLTGAVPPAGVQQQRRGNLTTITAFQSGHGYTSGGSGGTWTLNDTNIAFAGTQCTSVVTAGTGGSPRIRSATLSALDATGKDFVLWVRCPDVTHLRQIQVTFASSSYSNYRQWNVVDMVTQGITGQAMRSGEWFQVRFTFDSTSASSAGTQLRTNITDFQLVAIDDNTGNAVTVQFGYFGYYTRSSALSTGAISLSFDDSYADSLTRAAPALAAYGYAATAYTIVDLLSTSGFMSLADLHTLQEQYGWDVAGHAYTSAAHTSGFTALSASALDTELRNLKAWSLDNGFARGAGHLAYPGGTLNSTVETSARKFYTTGRQVYSAGPGAETVQPANPMRLRAQQAQTANLATVQSFVDQVAANGTWGLIAMHQIVASGASGSLQMNLADLNTLLAYIAGKSIPVLTCGQVFAASL